MGVPYVFGVVVYHDALVLRGATLAEARGSEEGSTGSDLVVFNQGVRGGLVIGVESPFVELGSAMKNENVRLALSLRGVEDNILVFNAKLIEVVQTLFTGGEGEVALLSHYHHAGGRGASCCLSEVEHLSIL